MSYSQVALPTRRAHVVEEGLAVLGLTGAFREAGWSQHHPCLPHPCAGGCAGTKCISTPQLMQFTTQLTEVSKGDIKYQLTTWSNWGMSMCLAFVGAFTSSGGELTEVSVSTTMAASSTEMLEFRAWGWGSIPACSQKLTDEYHELEGIRSCGAPCWGQSLSFYHVHLFALFIYLEDYLH